MTYLSSESFQFSDTRDGFHSERKEASFLDGSMNNVDKYFYPNKEEDRQEELNSKRGQIQMARRRRIYQGEYNRPYPRRKLLLYPDVLSPTISNSPSITNASKFLPTAAVTPSPCRSSREDCEQDWTVTPRQSEEDFDAPHDEITNYVSLNNLCDVDDEEKDDGLPTSPVLSEKFIKVSPEAKRRFKKRLVEKLRRKKALRNKGSTSTNETARVSEEHSLDTSPLGEIMFLCGPDVDTFCYSPPRSPVKTKTKKKKSRTDASDCKKSTSSQQSECSLTTPTQPVTSTEGEVSPLTIPGTVEESEIVVDKDFLKSNEKPSIHDVVNDIMEVPDKHRHHEAYLVLHKFLKKNQEHKLKLHVDDLQESIFDRIIESLYGNTKLESITIIRSCVPLPGSHRTVQELTFLFEAMRCIPQLNNLKVHNARADILGPLGDNLPKSLKKIHLQVLDDTIPNEFLDKIAKKGHLKEVVVEANGSMEIGRLVNSSSIEKIKVIGATYSMDPMHVQFFVDALTFKVSCSLKILDIQPLLGFDSWKPLMFALRSNNSIEVLKVSFIGNSEEEKNMAVWELAIVVECNTSLTRITNYTPVHVTITTEVAERKMLPALKSNTNLEHFQFFPESSMFWFAKDAILRRNREKGELSEFFYYPYVHLTSMLPQMKSQMCGSGTSC